MEKYNVFDCSIIELDKHHSDRKGNLTVVQNGDILPFDVNEFIICRMCREEKKEVVMHIVI